MPPPRGAWRKPCCKAPAPRRVAPPRNFAAAHQSCCACATPRSIRHRQTAGPRDATDGSARTREPVRLSGVAPCTGATTTSQHLLAPWARAPFSCRSCTPVARRTAPRPRRPICDALARPCKRAFPIGTARRRAPSHLARRPCRPPHRRSARCRRHWSASGRRCFRRRSYNCISTCCPTAQSSAGARRAFRRCGTRRLAPSRRCRVPRGCFARATTSFRTGGCS